LLQNPQGELPPNTLAETLAEAAVGCQLSAGLHLLRAERCVRVRVRVRVRVWELRLGRKLHNRSSPEAPERPNCS
jgi:hypothetical protein